MQVQQTMTREFVSIPSDTSVAQAAMVMRDEDVGMLPVISMAGTLAGVLTDRDIALRGVGGGHGPDTTVSRLMTEEVFCCRPDEDVDDAAARMAECHVRRLPVLDQHNALVGIVGLADVSRTADARTAQQTLSEITASRSGAR